MLANYSVHDHFLECNDILIKIVSGIPMEPYTKIFR